MKNLILFIALISLFVACKGNQQNINAITISQLPEKGTQKITIKVDSFVIPNAVFDSTDLAFWQIRELGDTTYSFLCNRHTEQFEIYNLDAPRLVWALSYKPILNEGEIQLQTWGADFYNLDSIFIFADEAITGFNSKGIFYQKKINLLQKKQKFITYGLRSYAINSIWDNKKNGFWIQGYCGDCNKDKNPVPYFSAPIEIFMPIDSTLAWDTVQATYPPRYRTDCNHGWHFRAFRAITPNSHVYSFSAEGDLYVYDMQTKTYTAKSARSQYDTIPFPCVNDLQKKETNNDDRVRHFNLSPNYGNIIYDPYRQLYYRFFYPALPEKNTEGFYNDLNDKEAVLMVFDKDFRLLTEWLLPQKQFLAATACVGEKGLYILNTVPQPYSFNYEQKISIINFVAE